MGNPPGFGPILEHFPDSEDYQDWMALPEELRSELLTYFADVRSGKIKDRSVLEMPCLWYDAETRRCKHYQYRPSVCREFEVGGEGCHGHRLAAGLE
jgi:Fe-S-cluster containining protein